MITLGLYQGENLPYFNKFSLDLSVKGVTIIRGRNLNAKNLKDRNNGSGKTLLLSGLPELLMNSNPAIERNENFARKALFPYKNSKLSLEINKTLVMKGRFNTASVGYSIENDNGSLEKVKKDVALDHLFETIRYNEDLFYTLVYLDGGRESPLLIGTSVQRMQFLSNIFPELEVFENIYGYFSSKLREVNKEVNTLNVLENELQEIQGEDQEDSPDIEELSASIAELKTQVKEQKEIVSTLSNQLHEVEMYNSYIKLKTKIDTLVKELGIPYNDAREKYQYYLDNSRKSEDYRAWVIKGKKLKKKVTYLSNYVEELELGNLDDSALNKKSSKYTRLPKEILEYTLLLVDKLNLPVIIGSVNNVDKAQDLLKYLDYISYCLNPRSNVVRKDPVLTVCRKLSMQESVEIESLVSSIRERCQTIVELKLSISEDEESVSEKDIKKASEARKNKRILKSTKEDLEYYRGQLETLRAKELEDVTDILDSDSLAKLKQLSEYAETFKVLGFHKESKKDLEKIVKQHKQAENKLNELKDQLNELQAEHNFLTENESTLDSLKSKIESLVKYRNVQEPLDVLKQAFSNKGIRVVLINQLATKLADSMNDSSHLTFPEPIKFRFEVSEKSCDIFAIRNPNTKHEVESDIRVLSRSERKSFALLLLYCLLPLTPKKRRFNIVAMDEMVANMDMVTRTKIFRDFIPALRERVPHILIADTGTLEIDDSMEYWVVKKGKESKLIPFDKLHEYEE
jgi:DNA repair exonuclease SbcCD ATPase subunit